MRLPGWGVHRRVGPVLLLADVLNFASAAVPLHAQLLHLQVLVGRSPVQFEVERWEQKIIKANFNLLYFSDTSEEASVMKTTTVHLTVGFQCDRLREFSGHGLVAGLYSERDVAGLKAQTC